MKGSRSRVRTGFYSLLFLSVVSSAPALAADLREGLDQMAVQLAKGAPEGKQFPVAVADFPDLQGVISDLGRFIANRITTRLVQNPKFSVIERQRLNQVLGELKFSMSDLVDPNKAKQFGQMVGVEGLIVGAVSDLGNQVDIDARMIEIESNKMLLGATVTISKDPTVIALLERGREMPTPPSVGAASTISTPTVALGTVKYQEFPEFRVEVAALRVLTGNNVELVLNYVNKTQKAFLLTLSGGCIGGSTIMSDDAGNDYRCASSTGIGARSYSEYLTLPPGSSSTASFRFRPPSQTAKKGSRFSFNKGSRFSFNGEHELYPLVESGTAKVQARYSISILNIEPR